MKNIKKYSFYFLLIGWGLMGVLFLSYNFIDDRDNFAKILSDLGAFGSFLSGIGTIIASIAAAIGVNSWITQLKTGKYLSIIWEAQINIRKFYSYTIELSIYKANYRRYNEINNEINNEISVTLSKQIEQLETQLKSQIKAMHNNFDNIDQIINKGTFIWSIQSSALEVIWNKIKSYLENSSYPTTPIATVEDANKISPLQNELNQLYNNLCKKLNALESNYTSI